MGSLDAKTRQNTQNTLGPGGQYYVSYVIEPKRCKEESDYRVVSILFQYDVTKGQVVF